MKDVVKREAKGPLGFCDIIRSDSAVPIENEIHHSPWLVEKTWVVDRVIIHDCLGGWTYALVNFVREDQN